MSLKWVFWGVSIFINELRFVFLLVVEDFFLFLPLRWLSGDERRWLGDEDLERRRRLPPDDETPLIFELTDTELDDKSLFIDELRYERFMELAELDRP